MAEITVRAETAVLGMRPGEEVVTEDTAFVRSVIEGGRLSLVDPVSSDVAALPSADGPPASGKNDPARGARAARGQRETTQGPALKATGPGSDDEA